MWRKKLKRFTKNNVKNIREGRWPSRCVMAVPFRHYLRLCRDWPPGQSCRTAAQKRRTVEDAGPYKDVPHFRFPVIPTKAQPRGGIRSLLPGKRILRLRCAPLRMTKRWNQVLFSGSCRPTEGRAMTIAQEKPVDDSTGFCDYSTSVSSQERTSPVFSFLTICTLATLIKDP